jgi:outer membrane murein-binding lipoprotein Lpp
MKRNVILSVVMVLCGPLLIAGCNENDRVAKVATQAAQRQAQQNTEMARLNREVAEGTRRMVEADAEARKDIFIVHQDIQAERAELSEGFDSLESERQRIAEQRRTESILAFGSVGRKRLANACT